MTFSNKQKGILALIGLAAIYASMGLYIRYLSVSFLFFQQIYLRLFSAIVIGFIIFNRSLNLSKIKKINRKEWLLLIFRSFTYYLLGLALFTKSILISKISTVSFISSLPMTAIIGSIIYKEKITIEKVFYLLISFIGVIIISVSDFSSILNWRLGELLAFISVIFTSLSIVLRKKHSKLLNNNEMSQLMIVIAFIMLLITSLFINEGPPVLGWNVFMIMILIIAGASNIILLFLTNYGFEKVKTITASNILTMEMFFAIIFGFIFFREIPSFKEIIGGILILLSVIQMNKLE